MRVFAILLLSLLPIGGLLAWVMVQNEPVVFAAPMDHSRVLPQGDFYSSAVVEPRDLNPLTCRDAWASSFVLRFTHDYLMRLDIGNGELVSVELPADGPRAGLLATAGFLAAHSAPEETSPVSRGWFIRVSLLCENIPEPPARCRLISRPST